MLIHSWLVVGPYPSEKYEFVNWDDDYSQIPHVSGKNVPMFPNSWFQVAKHRVKLGWIQWLNKKIDRVTQWFTMAEQKCFYCIIFSGNQGLDNSSASNMETGKNCLAWSTAAGHGYMEAMCWVKTQLTRVDTKKSSAPQDSKKFRLKPGSRYMIVPESTSSSTVNHRSLYPPVSSNMACWKMDHGNRWLSER